MGFFSRLGHKISSGVHRLGHKIHEKAGEVHRIASKVADVSGKIGKVAGVVGKVASTALPFTAEIPVVGEAVAGVAGGAKASMVSRGARAVDSVAKRL